MSRSSMIEQASKTPLGRYRVQAGYQTVQEGADAIGISRTHLVNFERGSAGVSPQVLARMAEVYGVSINTLEAAAARAQRRLYRTRLKKLA